MGGEETEPMVDPRIELTKLYALHKACIDIDHAIREAGKSDVDWRPFAPSRFVYAYFTFNSVYCYDWQVTVQNNELAKWGPDEAGRYLREQEQFKNLLRFCYDWLDKGTPELFVQFLSDALRLLQVSNPQSALSGIKASNEPKKVRNLRKAFPSNFATISRSDIKAEDHQAALIPAVRFIYAVRNNIFHGSKTRIDMLDPSQQLRLLIYTAILTSVDAVFFEAVQLTNLGWGPVPVRFQQGQAIRSP